MIYDKLIFVDIMSLFDCLLKLFNKNQHQKIKPEINYLPCSKIIDLDIAELNNIGTYVEYVNFIKSNKIRKFTSENDFNQIAILYYMYISMDYFVSKSKFNIKDAILRLLKFKLTMIDYLNEQKIHQKL